MFLSDTELEQLTGTKQPRKMIEWLRGEGFTFRVDRNGYPVVLAEHVAEVMGGRSSARSKERMKPAVNVTGLKKERANGTTAEATQGST